MSERSGKGYKYEKDGNRLCDFSYSFALRLYCAKNFSVLADKSNYELCPLIARTFQKTLDSQSLLDIDELAASHKIGTKDYSVYVDNVEDNIAFYIANTFILLHPGNDIYSSIHDVENRIQTVLVALSYAKDGDTHETLAYHCRCIANLLSNNQTRTEENESVFTTPNEAQTNNEPKASPTTEEQITLAKQERETRKEETLEREEITKRTAEEQNSSYATVSEEKDAIDEAIEEGEEDKEDEESSTTETIDNTQDLPRNRNQLVKEMETLLPDKECYLSGKIVEKFFKRARNISKTIDSYNVRPDIRRRIYLESIAFVFSNELCLHLLKSQIKNTIGNLSYSVDRERGEFFKSVSGMRNALKINSDRENFTRQELAILFRRLNEYVYAILVEDDVDYLGTSYLSFDSLADAVAGCRQDPVGRTYLLFADYVYYTLLDRTDLTLGDLGPIYIDDLFDIAKISVPFGLITQAANSQTKEISREGSLTYYNTTNVFNNDVFVPSKAKTQQQEVGCLIFAILAVIALLTIAGIIITGGNL